MCALAVWVCALVFLCVCKMRVCGCVCKRAGNVCISKRESEKEAERGRCCTCESVREKMTGCENMGGNKMFLEVLVCRIL